MFRNERQALQISAKLLCQREKEHEEREKVRLIFACLTEISYFCVMKQKIKTLMQQLLRSPREFPVEAAMGVAFFLIAAFNTASSEWAIRIADYLSADILLFFLPLMVLTFRLHRVNRWAYILSVLLFIPLMALDLKPFLYTYGFGFTYVLAAILLVAGTWRMDNRRFPLIAVAPLILYWIGSIYRIHLYSFTESRFYLMVAGVLMTLFVLMLLWRRSRRFQLMALIFGAAIILFTYIPGISAKSIGLRCQTARMERLIQDLKLIDKETGKLVAYVDVPTVLKDSLQCERYQNVCSTIEYVKKGMGSDEFIQRYGEWEYNEYNFYYGADDFRAINDVTLNKSVSLGEYTELLPDNTYSCYYSQGELCVTINKASVLRYPIDSIAHATPQFSSHPERFLIYKNDSLLVVLKKLSLDSEKQINDVDTYNVMLFRKKQK